MNNINPPAIVHAHVDLKTLAANINAGHRATEDAAQGTAKHARNTGRMLLRVKKHVGHGHFQQWMKENLKFSAQTARSYMRAAVAGAKTKARAFVLADDLKPLTEDGPEPEPSELPDETPLASVAPATPKLISSLACRCFSPKILPRIESLPEAAQEAVNARLDMRMELLKALGEVEELFREPGDDTAEEAAAAEAEKDRPKNGSILFDWNAFFQAYGLAVRQIDKLGGAYRCKETQQVDELRDKLEGWKEDFKDVYEQVAKQKAPGDSILDPENRSQRRKAMPMGAPRTTFKAPTLEEVRAYCQERKNSVDPQAWMDHYTSNGWKVGRNPMRDWRACVRNWETNRFGGGYGRSATPQRQNDRFIGPGEPVDDEDLSDIPGRDNF